jgi:uncharacterized protein
MDDAFAQHGAFSWCELMTTDIAAAKEFYSALLGWSITETPVGDTSYHLISIVPLTDIPDVGRFYTFQDPQGAVLSVISYVAKSAE